jgi:uncharacterized protein YndB with AHSA1/START domain
MTTASHSTPPARRDVARDSVRATIDIAAPPEHVFNVLTDPQELAEWWGSDDTYRTHDWRVDARPGGEWSMRTTDRNGGESAVHGEYRVVDPPHVLEHSWHADWDDVAQTVVRYELVPVEVDGAPGTRLTVTHTGTAARAQAGAMRAVNWHHVVQWLAGHAAACLL